MLDAAEVRVAADAGISRCAGHACEFEQAGRGGATAALAQFDVENYYRLRAIRGRPEVGLALLDTLDGILRRRWARAERRKAQAVVRM